MNTLNLNGSVECLDFRAMSKNSLLGFAEFTLKVQCSSGYVTLKIKDCTIHEKEGSRWVNFPSKAFEKDGQVQYTSFIQFESKDQREAFSRAALNALNNRYPDALKEVA